MDDLEKQLKENYKKYLSYNQLRIERLLNLMPAKKEPLYYVLPFLLNCNDPRFPGYIDDPHAVSGVFRFCLDQLTKKAILRLFPSFKGKDFPAQPEPGRCVVKSLMLMGSLGTIAQNQASDFDFWVCVSLDKLTGDQIKCLEKKLLSVEAWADQAFGLEVHFFITDIKSVRTNKFGAADKESAGSSQARLLKEEFYRTTIFVAGKIPFWWITPPDISDKEYRECKEAVKKSKSLKPEHLIDLGHLSEISSDEFFGAAIWQICKAMDSPYKSVLKMAMLAVFLDPEKKNRLLCDTLKMRVQAPHAGQGNPKYYDPYTILFDTILTYYRAKNDPETLDLFQTCLYIKTGVKAGSESNLKTLNFKEQIIADYTKSWEWKNDKLKDLDTFKEWDFEKVRELGNRVHKFLIDAYQTLSKMLREDGNKKQAINSQDITVIGRKLESFYTVKPCKIIYMKRAFTEGLLQESITIIADCYKSQDQLWSIYRGQIRERSLREEETRLRLLKKGQNLIEIFVWAIFNRLIDKNTSVYLLPNPSPVTMTDIQDFIVQFMDIFPSMKISSLSNNALLAKERKTAFYFVINFGSQKWQTDIEKVNIIYKNSWGEMFCHSEEKQGRTFLSQFMENASLNEGNIEESESKFQFFIPKGKNSRTLRTLVEDLINTSYLSSVKEA